MEKKHTNKQKIENLYYNGGPFGMYPMPMLPDDGPALRYNYMSGLQNNKDKQVQAKDKVTATNFGGPIKGFAEGGLLANPDGLMFTEDEVANIVRANTNKGRKKRMEEAKESKKSYRGVLPESDGTLFAIGGDLQTHGSDWSTKAMHINAGGRHEENPNDGIQIGTDSEGVPNLVEEGEIIYDDYVFSNRIELDDKAKEALHFPKKAELTYAEAAKKLEKEISERPNDAVSQAGFKAQMEQLEEQQERQKQEMEAERAKEAFEALSPEEQTALMQQKAQQDAMEEQAAQEQVVAEQQAMAQGQPSPEEMAAIEQQAAMAQQQMTPEEAAMTQQQMAAQQGGMPVEGMAPEGYAYGGDLNEGEEENLYLNGGILDYVNRNYKGGNKKAIAQTIEKYLTDKGKSRKQKIRGKDGKIREEISFIPSDISGALDMILNPKVGRKTPNDDRTNHFKMLTGLGMPRNVAFGLAFPENKVTDFRWNGNGKDRVYDEATGGYYDDGAYQQAINTRNRYYQMLVGEYTDEKGNTYRLGEDRKYHIVGKPTSGEDQKTILKAVADEKAKREAANNGGTDPYINKTILKAGDGAVANATAQPVVDNAGNIIAYDWYRNGSDGIGDPIGFTVGKDGLIDTKDGYTKQYRETVDSLTADNIRQWAKERGWHEGMTDYSPITDPSLKSFLEKGNKLEKLQTDQWRAGATDGRYGFMHHVASDILKKNTQNAPIAATEATGEAPRTVGMSYITDDPNAKETRTVDANGNTIVRTPVYQDPNAAADNTKAAYGEAKKDFRLKPNYLEETNYGLLGPLVGLGLMSAGVGKPDYTEMDKALANASRAYHTATNKYLGNYMKYKPIDTWFNQAKIDAQARATDRAIINSGVNQGSIIAGLNQNGYNALLASGENLRADNMYNRSDEFKTNEYNKGTDLFNAQAYNQLSQFNTSEANRFGLANAQLGLEAAQNRLANNAGWYNSLYGNIAAGFNNLKQWEKWKRDRNLLAEMWASGLAGNVSDKVPVASRMVTVVPAAEGGKVKRKKGKRRGLII